MSCIDPKLFQGTSFNLPDSDLNREVLGFNHVHFHVIARLPDWPTALKGPQVFSGLGNKVNNPLPSEVVIPLVLEIQEYLVAAWA